MAERLRIQSSFAARYEWRHDVERPWTHVDYRTWLAMRMFLRSDALLLIPAEEVY